MLVRTARVAGWCWLVARRLADGGDLPGPPFAFGTYTLLVLFLGVVLTGSRFGLRRPRPPTGLSSTVQ